MNTIPHRELRNNSSAILARVKEGEVIGVTNNGELAAVLVPPGRSEYDLLVEAGEVMLASDDTPGFAQIDRIPAPPGGTKAMLDDARGKW